MRPGTLVRVGLYRASRLRPRAPPRQNGVIQEPVTGCPLAGFHQKVKDFLQRFSEYRIHCKETES